MSADAKPEKGAVDSRPEVKYLPNGERPDPYADNTPLLDPDLEKARDEEAKKLAEVKIEPRAEVTIDPELVKIRDAEVKRLGGREVKAEANEAPADDKPAAKKAPARKSSSK